MVRYVICLSRHDFLSIDSESPNPLLLTLLLIFTFICLLVVFARYFLYLALL